ncbi:hypothetical protein DFS34DRAFT_597274 [Phlyctochytrium arcticum]|nr:hypothetical protein DFS34DRAFT_597274 [Phlyctochytrium arcticum]
MLGVSSEHPAPHTIRSNGESPDYLHHTNFDLQTSLHQPQHHHQQQQRHQAGLVVNTTMSATNHTSSSYPSATTTTASTPYGGRASPTESQFSHSHHHHYARNEIPFSHRTHRSACEACKLRAERIAEAKDRVERNKMAAKMKRDAALGGYPSSSPSHPSQGLAPWRPAGSTRTATRDALPRLSPTPSRATAVDYTHVGARIDTGLSALHRRPSSRASDAPSPSPRRLLHSNTLDRPDWDGSFTRNELSPSPRSRRPVSLLGLPVERPSSGSSRRRLSAGQGRLSDLTGSNDTRRLRVRTHSSSSQTYPVIHHTTSSATEIEAPNPSSADSQNNFQVHLVEPIITPKISPEAIEEPEPVAPAAEDEERPASPEDRQYAIRPIDPETRTIFADRLQEIVDGTDNQLVRSHFQAWAIQLKDKKGDSIPTDPHVSSEKDIKGQEPQAVITDSIDVAVEEEVQVENETAQQPKDVVVVSVSAVESAIDQPSSSPTELASLASLTISVGDSEDTSDLPSSSATSTPSEPPYPDTFPPSESPSDVPEEPASPVSAPTPPWPITLSHSRSSSRSSTTTTTPVEATPSGPSFVIQRRRRTVDMSDIKGLAQHIAKTLASLESHHQTLSNRTSPLHPHKTAYINAAHSITETVRAIVKTWHEPAQTCPDIILRKRLLASLGEAESIAGQMRHVTRMKERDETDRDVDGQVLAGARNLGKIIVQALHELEAIGIRLE